MKPATSHLKPKRLPMSAVVSSTGTAGQTDDALDIPSFLVMTQAQRAAGWANWTPRVVLPPDKVEEKNIASEIKQEIVDAKLRKRRADTLRNGRIARDANRPDAPWKRKTGLSQADHARIERELSQLGPAYVNHLAQLFKFDVTTRRWLPRNQQPTPKPAPAKRVMNIGDDTSTRLLGYDRDQLLALARANDVYDPRYEALPNPGLVRMTVGNRIRARAKRGPINWV